MWERSEYDGFWVSADDRKRRRRGDAVTGVPARIGWELPPTVHAIAEAAAGLDRDDEARMRFVLELVHANIDLGGGPFAAAVFDDRTGAVRAVGVNLVVPFHAAVAHAEVVAIAMAGVAGSNFDLSAAGPATMVASTEPCAMCLGAVAWSGVGRLVCGARDVDARAIGFDEGHKPADWIDGLARRGVTVMTDVLRDEAAGALQRYLSEGLPIYNSRGAERLPDPDHPDQQTSHPEGR